MFTNSIIYTLEMASKTNVRVHILSFVSIKWWNGVNCHSIIYSGKIMWLILMTASHLKRAYEYANRTAIPLLIQYSFQNISEDSGVGRRTLGNIEAQDPADETARPKYTVISLENKEKSNVMNVLQGKCAVTSNIPTNRYKTRVASNLGKCLSEWKAFFLTLPSMKYLWISKRLL